MLVRRMLGLLIIVCLMLSVGDLHADEDLISVTPESVLFDIDQLKPGDYMTDTIAVQNETDQPLSVEVGSNFISGSDKLYNQFRLTVSNDDGEVVFDGRLADFDGVEGFAVNASESSDYTLRVLFPESSDNAYQGLRVKFNLTFATTIDDGEASNPPDDDEVLPTTGDDTSDRTLPQTGETIPYAFYILGGLSMLTGIALFVWRRKRIQLAVDDT
ncbi:LPXTG-motif cell wall-anchored protein [Alkalibacillus flavidus]|uniref:LPXTG-motif cell wall-anchored protein n=1 Tax=Alkalibacillus flavidus TaxID=546021 RepID=A0ABV2KX79_9BACI